MKTIAFYSYKGGVGRTLAVAHVAYWLSKQGKTVFMLDMDMEAPGLHYKLEQYNEPPKPDKGLVDYIGHFRRTGMASSSLTDYVITLAAKELEMSKMWLMPAGNPFAGDYWKQLSEIEWKDFLYSGDKLGSLLFLELKAHIEIAYNPDFLLIDSRTGLTDLTGIGLDLLADDAVILGVNNPENIDGSRIVMEKLRRRDKLSFKEEKTRLHFVLTRIPAPERKEDLERESAIKSKAIERLNQESGLASGPLVTKINVIHIDPDQAVGERMRFKEQEWRKYPILIDYQRLVLEVTGLGRDSQGLSFAELMEEFDLESEPTRKRELAELILHWETNSGDIEFKKGWIAENFMEDDERALGFYEHAIKLQPLEDDLYYFSSNIYQRKGEFGKALEGFTKAISINPENPEHIADRAEVYADMEAFQLALQDYDSALKLNGKFHQALAGKAIVYEEMGEIVLAIRQYDTCIAHSPSDPQMFLYRGRNHQQLGNLETAIADFDEAIRLKPDFASAYIDRGDCYLDFGDFENAIADITRAIILDPGNANHLNSRGVAFIETEDFDLAIADFHRAISIGPVDALFYSNLALTHFLMGNYDFAILDAEKSIEVNDGEPAAYIVLADSLSAKDDIEGFYKNFELALANDPGERDYLDESTRTRHQDEPRFQALLQKYAPK